MKRILVADDDPKFLRPVTEILTGTGYDSRAIGDVSYDAPHVCKPAH